MSTPWLGSSPWSVGTLTQCGTRHAKALRPNEDAVQALMQPSGVWSLAVADGVGSGERGDLASDLVARHWVDCPAPTEPSPALQAAGQALEGCEGALSQGLRAAGVLGHGRSGSMLVGAWLYPTGEVVLGHVGDCRAYRIRRGELALLTRDHSYQNLGLQHPAWGKPDHPARMVGGAMMGPADVQRTAFLPGDWLLLCSDGLHGAFSDALFGACIRKLMAVCHPIRGRGEGLTRAICGYLSKQAVEAGGHDDVTVALARFGGAGPSQPLAIESKNETRESQGDWGESVWPSDDFEGASSETVTSASRRFSVVTQLS